MSAMKRAVTGFTRARVRNLLIAVLVPLAIVGVYFSALGGSAQRDAVLPVLIVNNDQMVEHTNTDGTTTQVVAGRLLVSWLTKPENAGGYAWELVNADTARQRLEGGTAYAAVSIPSDFSAAVVSLSGASPRAARIDVTVAQSADWLTGEVMQRVFAGMTAQFGQEITQQLAVGLTDGMSRSADGLTQAADGSQQLADGAGTLGAGLTQYADGVRGYVDGVQQYTSGVDALASGASQLGGGAQRYTAGVGQYVQGVQQLADGLERLDGGGAQLKDAAAQLDAVAGQLGAGGEVRVAAEQLRVLGSQLSGLSGLDLSGFTKYCDQLLAVDPAQAQSCRGEVAAMSGKLPGAAPDLAEVSAKLEALAGQLDRLQGAGAQLTQLSQGLVQYTDGVQQLTGGAAQLDAAGRQLAAGGDTLASGASGLVSGAQQVQAGGAQLQRGGLQLTDSGGALGEGAQRLREGASSLTSSLRDGAQQAKGAVSDPDAFAATVAQPVVAQVNSVHNPTFAGVLAASLLPLGVWLAGLVTVLRRGLVTEEMLQSSASSWSILRVASSKLAQPLLIVAGVVALAQHAVFGVPWSGVGVTVLFGVLAVACTTALHLLFVACGKRRTAAMSSVVVLALQLVLARGVLPLELRAEWVAALGGWSPLGQLAAGAQAGYAGGAVGQVVVPALVLVVMTVAVGVVASVVLRLRRRADAKAQLVVLAG